MWKEALLREQDIRDEGFEQGANKKAIEIVKTGLVNGINDRTYIRDD